MSLSPKSFPLAPIHLLYIYCIYICLRGNSLLVYIIQSTRSETTSPSVLIGTFSCTIVCIASIFMLIEPPEQFPLLVLPVVLPLSSNYACGRLVKGNIFRVLLSQCRSVYL